MKLKNVLMLAFFILTLIPTLIISCLLYTSGFNLSKELYTKNMTESISVQADYISQTIQDNMLKDYRFTNSLSAFGEKGEYAQDTFKTNVIDSFGAYLSVSEDKYAVCLLLDNAFNILYSIGDKTQIQHVSEQIPKKEITAQAITELQLPGGEYTIGAITPVFLDDATYAGMLVSVYDKNYVLKIISSYYKLSGTEVYISRENGDIIDSRSNVNADYMARLKMWISEENSAQVTNINTQSGIVRVCKAAINNSPWYLLGEVSYLQISTSMNNFVWVYIFIAFVVLAADIALSVYFSNKTVKPINKLIAVIEGYPFSLDDNFSDEKKINGYYETTYLKEKFMGLMKAIRLAQHNFDGVFTLYQSGAMDDITIDIDVKSQTVHSNSESFEKLLKDIKVREGACIVERFTNCFGETDQKRIMQALESMRDKHLSVSFECDAYTPYLLKNWYRVLVVPMYEEERLARLFVQLRDVSRFKQQELKSKEEAMRDYLTGLYNRTGLFEYVKQAEVTENGTQHALLFIDMDYFKMVNDNFGHSAGDSLLCSVSGILQQTIESSGIAARIGGDEFVVLLTNITEKAAETVKEQLLARLSFPYSGSHAEFTVTASIGLAMWNISTGEALEHILNKADKQMYTAKREFKLRSKEK